jgi:hypothetical protein
MLAEAGNGFVIGNKLTQHPYHLEIATGLALEPSTRLRAIEIAIDVEFQKRRRVIGRSSRGCRLDPIEAHNGRAATYTMLPVPDLSECTAS